MSWDVEVGCYWFLSTCVLDVTMVTIEADVEGVLCLSHILLLASPSLNEVDDITCLAGGCSLYMEGLDSGGARKCLPGTDVLACEAAAMVRLTVG